MPRQYAGHNQGTGHGDVAEDGMKLVRIGMGEVVSQLGLSNGCPCVIIEPVPVSGEVGTPGPDEMNRGPVHEDGLVLEIHTVKGAEILIEDLQKVIGKLTA
jgi:hypothetical protein